jgi:cell division septation protein DedD
MFCQGCGKELTEGGRFCVGCGAELPAAANEGTPTRGSADAPPVLDRGPGARPTPRVDPAATQTVALDSSTRQSRAAQVGAAPPAARRSLTPWLGGVAAGVLIAGIAFAFFLKGGGSAGGGANESDRSAANVNLKQSLAPQALVTSTPQPAWTTPTPQPTVEAARQDALKRPTQGAPDAAAGVRASLEGWAAATRNHDFEAHMSFYADTLSFYYRLSNVSVGVVRADRWRAFTKFTTLDVQLSNVVVTPDPSGLKATATYDKSWNFAGDKTTSGAVRQMVTLENTGGRWLITGEKDLQIYYLNR